MFRKIKSVSINYVILNGCRHHCTGCTIERDSNPQITEKDYQDLDYFYQDLKKNNVYIGELALGSTDFLSCSNRTELLSDPRLHKLIAHGKEIDFSLTCLDTNTERLTSLAKDILRIPSKPDIELGIPYEIQHIDNPKYEKTIVTTINKLQELLDNRITDIQFTVNYSRPDFIKKFGKDLDPLEMCRLMDRSIYPNSWQDLNLPDLKLNLKDINVRQSLKESIHYANQIYLTKVKEDLKRNYATWFYVLIQEGMDESFRLNYYDSELYLCTNIFDNAFTIFPEFKVKKPWTHDNLLLTIQEMIDTAFEYSLKTDSCSTCPYLPQCATKGTLALMQTANYKHCISMMKDNAELLQEHQDLVKRQGNLIKEKADFR